MSNPNLVDMPQISPENLMYRLFELRDELNSLVFPFVGVGKIFDTMTMIQPKFQPAELGCIRAVAWLYSFYFEAGKIGVNFLIKYIDVYSLDVNSTGKDHFLLVQNLRTYFVHNLDVMAKHDQKIIRNCQSWFKKNCGSNIPGDETHWHLLLIRLLTDAIAFIETIRDCVRKIEVDENTEMIVGQWAQRVKRYYPPNVFDEVIPSILNDLGRSEMDPIRLRKKYYSDWIRAVEMLNDDHDFNTEARRLIEGAAISECSQTLPITGVDIMETFAIPPGPQIGELLIKAKQIYEAQRCDKLKLLNELRLELKLP